MSLWKRYKFSGSCIKEFLSVKTITEGSILPLSPMANKCPPQEVPWFASGADQYLSPATDSNKCAGLVPTEQRPALPSIISHCLLSATGLRPCSTSSLSLHQDSSETRLLPDKSCSTATEGKRIMKEKHSAVLKVCHPLECWSALSESACVSHTLRSWADGTSGAYLPQRCMFPLAPWEIHKCGRPDSQQ